MIFDKRSNSMLKYEKSRSKLIEFSIAKENYPLFPYDSDDLTYSTLFALSCFCEELIEHPDSTAIHELKSELIVVSQYYDVTVKTQHRENHSNLFLLLGATAYFLAENFGSAKVLISQINEWSDENIVMTLLYATLNYLLTGESLDIKTQKRRCIEYWEGVIGHFKEGHSIGAVFNALRKLRTSIHRSTDVLAVTYIDFLFAVTICATNHSAWILLPKHSGFDSVHWSDYLSREDSIKLLWPAQKVILEAGALEGKDIVVPLPTGVGKTKSIELLLRARFMDKENSISVIIAPLRALCNEISSDLSTSLSDEVIINQFTDTAQEDFDLELISNKKYVFICTPEKFSYILRHEPEFLASIQLFIFDEAHLFDDVSRGAQYELLVSEIGRGRSLSAQMVLFSAVLSNAGQIGGWLFNDVNATVDHLLVKSTEKSIGFLSSDQTLHYFEKDDMSSESFFVPKSISFTELSLLGSERKKRIFPKNTSQDIAIYYAVKLCLNGGTAIYAGQVRSIAPIMRRIVELSERQYDLSSLLTNGKADEAAKLSNLFKLHYGSNSEVTRATVIGAFPHYGDLPNGLKMAIEHALRRRYISFVVCTTTLAEGVNIPIKYLFLTTFSLGASSMQIRKMQNMVGRTARSGIHTEGSAIITDTKIYDKRLDWKTGGSYKWQDSKKMFDYGSAEACTSAILSLVSNLSVDYQYHYEATSIIPHILKHYGEPDCFSVLTTILLNSYKKLIDDEQRYNRYASDIGIKISQLERTIESVENYLCYIFNEEHQQEHFVDTVTSLVRKTFAYFLGDDNQKKALTAIFQLIAKKITTAVEPEKAAYFAKSLYGINTSSRILHWTNEHLESLAFCSEKNLIEQIFNLFIELFPDQITIEVEKFLSVLQLWINGNSYINIFSELSGVLTMSQIEKLCSKTISYYFCFLMGNILDAIDGQSDELAEKMNLLQKKIKYGVPTLLQILICENLFDDRIIASELEQFINPNILTDKDLKKHMAVKKAEITQLLKPYPDYFNYRFRMYIK